MCHANGRQKSTSHHKIYENHIKINKDSDLKFRVIDSIL